MKDLLSASRFGESTQAENVPHFFRTLAVRWSQPQASSMHIPSKAEARSSACWDAKTPCWSSLLFVYSDRQLYKKGGKWVAQPESISFTRASVILKQKLLTVLLLPWSSLVLVHMIIGLYGIPLSPSKFLIKRNQKKKRQAKNKTVFWTWHSRCTQELTAAVVICTRLGSFHYMWGGSMRPHTSKMDYWLLGEEI